MKILKFGGSSVGDAARINSVVQIITKYHTDNVKIAVVLSAFQGVTDQLVELIDVAARHEASYLGKFQNIRLKHLNVITELFPETHAPSANEKVNRLLNELKDLIYGIYLLKDITPRIRDLVLSFGERLSCTIVSELLIYKNINSEYCDASNLIRTNDHYGNAKVNFDITNKNIEHYFSEHSSLQIITGFIASTSSGEITTIGRGGSDYTASIIGAALNVDEIEIWTDVNGIMTADPRKVKSSIPLKAVTYQEAMEMSYFGAKVIHPPTMQPAFVKNIKIRIRNTFNPEFKGTVIILKEPHLKFSAKGISSIDDVTLLKFEGSGMVANQEIVWKIFKVLNDKSIPVLLITQGSSGISLCIAVLPDTAPKAKQIIENELRLELIDGIINPIEPEENLSLVAVVGEDMRKTPGVAGKVFRALGKNGINLIAIAQGSSELNISFIIQKIQLSKALNVLHDSMFLSVIKELNVFLVGTGLVGGALLDYITQKRDYLESVLHTRLNLIAVANSKKMYFNEAGIKTDEWKENLTSSDLSSETAKFILEMKKMNLANTVFIDCTAKDSIIPFYNEILESNISIVTPNKIANTLPYKDFIKLKETAKRNNVQFQYSTNVGAALPMINIVQDLVESGERIRKIEGVLSGTLSFIFNSFEPGRNFSDIVREARELGFTEPDPRNDLNGMDVARKLLILMRESGVKSDLTDIEIENLVPEEAAECTIDDFFKILQKKDLEFFNRLKTASDKNKKLRFVATYEEGKAKAGIREVGIEHPFYYLSGNENILLVETDNHSPIPLVLRGKGSGADYTAFGIFSDIIKISKYLG